MTDLPAARLKPTLRTWNLFLFGIVAIAPIAGVTMYGYVSALSGFLLVNLSVIAETDCAGGVGDRLYHVEHCAAGASAWRGLDPGRGGDFRRDATAAPLLTRR